LVGNWSGWFLSFYEKINKADTLAKLGVDSLSSLLISTTTYFGIYLLALPYFLYLVTERPRKRRPA